MSATTNVRTSAQLRAASASWLIVARRKAGFGAIDERAAAVRAAKYCRRQAWRLDAAALVR